MKTKNIQYLGLNNRNTPINKTIQINKIYRIFNYKIIDMN